MGKNPCHHEQWYSGDWFRSVDVRKCSWSTRGIWREMLDIMVNETETGKIRGSHEEICRVVGCTKAELRSFCVENKRHRFADVTFCNKIVTIINRRMYRDFLDKKAGKERVQQFRDRAKQNCNANVTGGVTGQKHLNAKDSNSNSINFSTTINRRPELSGLDLGGQKEGMLFADKLEEILGPFNNRECNTFKSVVTHMIGYARDRDNNQVYVDVLQLAKDKIEYICGQTGKEKVDARRIFISQVKKKYGYKGKTTGRRAYG